MTFGPNVVDEQSSEAAEKIEVVGLRMPYVPEMTVYNWDSSSIQFWMPRAVMLMQAAMLVMDNDTMFAVQKWLETEESKRTKKALKDIKRREARILAEHGRTLFVSFGKWWHDISIDNGKEAIRMEMDLPESDGKPGRGTMTFTREDFE